MTTRSPTKLIFVIDLARTLSTFCTAAINSAHHCITICIGLKFMYLFKNGFSMNLSLSFAILYGPFFLLVLGYLWVTWNMKRITWQQLHDWSNLYEPHSKPSRLRASTNFFKNKVIARFQPSWSCFLIFRTSSLDIKMRFRRWLCHVSVIDHGRPIRCFFCLQLFFDFVQNTHSYQARHSPFRMRQTRRL